MGFAAAAQGRLTFNKANDRSTPNPLNPPCIQGKGFKRRTGSLDPCRQHACKEEVLIAGCIVNVERVGEVTLLC